MARARRFVFAAPLVLVTACGQPRPPSAQAVVSPSIVATAEVAPDAGAEVAPDAGGGTTPTGGGADDAGTVAVAEQGAATAGGPEGITPEQPRMLPGPVDAASSFVPEPPAVRPGAVLLRLGARSIQRDGFVSCHDFGPSYRGCNPPRPEPVPASTMSLPLFERARRPDATVISVPLGKRDGIQRAWPIVLRAPARKPTRRPAPAAKILDVSERETRIATNLTSAELRAGIELELGGRRGGAWVPLVHAPVMVELLDVQASGASSIVTIAAGNTDHVEVGWTIVLVDRRGRPLRGGRGVVLRVHPYASLAKVPLSIDRARRAQRARIEPPPLEP